ncbi:MAG: NAD(P)H-hydrate epimerase, partial [Lachnospiraceae bacterium]|nr:NAD(P)H-hydrate epimerase [Lachnospiraceae bacterium]
MLDILSVENMRNSDSQTIAGGVSGRELMMRAGRAIFESVVWRPPVAIVCGSGNNAGDGYVLAKLLHYAGIDCTIMLLEERFSEDGKYYYEICRESGIRINVLTMQDIFDVNYSTIVDCIFGTGFKGPIRENSKAAAVIDSINKSGAYVVSVDINSGLNGDSGMAAGSCVRSDITVSVGSFKPGHFLSMAKDV